MVLWWTYLGKRCNCVEYIRGWSVTMFLRIGALGPHTPSLGLVRRMGVAPLVPSAQGGLCGCVHPSEHMKGDALIVRWWNA